jgi:hypothetical protein
MAENMSKERCSELISFLQDLLNETDAEDWPNDKIRFEFDDHGNNITIEMDDLNDQDYEWIKGKNELPKHESKT